MTMLDDDVDAVSASDVYAAAMSWPYCYHCCCCPDYCSCWPPMILWNYVTMWPCYGDVANLMEILCCRNRYRCSRYSVAACENDSINGLHVQASEHWKTRKKRGKL